MFVYFVYVCVCVFVCVYVMMCVCVYGVYVCITAASTPSSNTPHLLSTPSPPLPSEARSDDEKAIQELKNMLTSSMEARDRANTERKVRDPSSLLCEFTE